MQEDAGVPSAGSKRSRREFIGGVAAGAAALSVSPLLAGSQKTCVCKVVDGEGQPMPGVRVRYGTELLVTDGQGKCTFKWDPATGKGDAWTMIHNHQGLDECSI